MAYKNRITRSEEAFRDLMKLLEEDPTIDPYTDIRFITFILEIDIDYMMVRVLY